MVIPKLLPDHLNKQNVPVKYLALNQISDNNFEKRSSGIPDICYRPTILSQSPPFPSSHGIAFRKTLYQCANAPCSPQSSVLCYSLSSFPFPISDLWQCQSPNLKMNSYHFHFRPFLYDLLIDPLIVSAVTLFTHPSKCFKNIK